MLAVVVGFQELAGRGKDRVADSMSMGERERSEGEEGWMSGGWWLGE